jgi:hypothetical protein
MVPLFPTVEQSREESSVLPQEETSPWVTKLCELFLGRLDEGRGGEQFDKICENYNRGEIMEPPEGIFLLDDKTMMMRFIIEHARL